MVTFNFTDNANDVQIRVQTTSYGDLTVSPIPGPATLTTNPTGVANPVEFTITGLSTFYSGVFQANLDFLRVTDGQPSAIGNGVVELDWTDNFGNSALVNPIADLSGLNPGEAIWTVNGSSVGAVQDNVQFNGVVTGIRFVTQDTVTLLSLEGTLTCFAAGTRIATPAGETLVEDLAIGDQILTHDGQSVAVKWIGQETTDTRFGIAERKTLIKITAGALDHTTPDRDLVVTADHAMLVDGVLVAASALVNGTTFHQVDMTRLPQQFTVYHIETEAHQVVIANGAPAETYIDYVSRRVFDNYDEYIALYGDEPTLDEMPYPRVLSKRQLPPAIKSRLAARAAA